ncbi:hypothetical protein EJP02_295 [Escherichia phage EJP2]|nr:hypothetical protein EJP02_295 [Escherichia phage EJP2]
MKDSTSDFMEGMLSSLNDIEDGIQPQSRPQQNYNHNQNPNQGFDVYAAQAESAARALNETKNLLEGLTDIGFEYGNINNPDAEAQSQRAPTYSESPSTYAQPVYNEPKIQKPSRHWSLVENILQGTKSTKVYSIKCNYSNEVLMDGMLMFESSQTLVNLLNEGRNLSDIKVLGIISSGIQYSTVVMETLRNVKKRQKVLNESQYDVAKDLDVVISEKKNEAKQLRNRVIKFLVDEGYITK